MGSNKVSTTSNLCHCVVYSVSLRNLLFFLGFPISGFRCINIREILFGTLDCTVVSPAHITEMFTNVLQTHRTSTPTKTWDTARLGLCSPYSTKVNALTSSPFSGGRPWAHRASPVPPWIYLHIHKGSCSHGCLLLDSPFISSSEQQRVVFVGVVGWATVARTRAVRTLGGEVLSPEDRMVFSARETCALKRKEQGEDPGKVGGTGVCEDPGGLSEEVRKVPRSSL